MTDKTTQSAGVLAKINTPQDMKALDRDDLKHLASDVRDQMIHAVSKTGGHLGAGLGVVELTVALHYVFDTPNDKLIWDVGHQCYPHKILTGRKNRIETLRQGGGLSGFTKRSESVYDPFGAAHSSTSISAGLGMAVARDIKGENFNVVSVIGDGAMSAGMAYEAMNNAGAQKSNMIVILNDNDMSIDPPVGALSNYLSRLASSRPYRELREIGKKITRRLPAPVERAAKRAEEYARGALKDGTIFEEMGFYYIGPIDGHNLDHLIPVLENIRDSRHKGPVMVHIRTKKGYGYTPAENAADKMHGVAKFDVVTGTQNKPAPSAPSYTSVFADSLISAAAADDKIVAVTAAMPSGTGLNKFAKAYPDRCFDVGIAEQHGVTFAAGLAAEGMKPFAAIYSTFLQRGYDQVVHDVALQNLPVRFAIDRAGLVGADGQTHAGAFDIAYLGCLPNMVLMAAGDEAELMNMTHTAADYDAGPIAFRYPRGEGRGVALPKQPEILTIGQGRFLAEGQDLAIISYGGRLAESLLAAEMLQKQGLSVTVFDARFAKPLDEQNLQQIARHHPVILTVEEGAIGGFGSYVLDYFNRIGALEKIKLACLTLPDMFQDQDSPARQYDEAGLNAAQILDRAMQILGTDTSANSLKVVSSRPGRL